MVEVKTAREGQRCCNCAGLTCVSNVLTVVLQLSRKSYGVIKPRTDGAEKEGIMNLGLC